MVRRKDYNAISYGHMRFIVRSANAREVTVF